MRRVAAPFAEAGLIVDIAGAWAIALGLMWRREEDIVTEVTNWAGYNEPLLESIAKQKADAQVGAVLLTIGFAGQFVASIGWEPSWAHWWWTIPAAIAVATGGFAFLMWFWRPRMVRLASARLSKSFQSAKRPRGRPHLPSVYQERQERRETRREPARASGAETAQRCDAAVQCRRRRDGRGCLGDWRSRVQIPAPR
jgi:hypothetical protein